MKGVTLFRLIVVAMFMALLAVAVITACAPEDYQATSSGGVTTTQGGVEVTWPGSGVFKLVDAMEHVTCYGVEGGGIWCDKTK